MARDTFFLGVTPSTSSCDVTGTAVTLSAWVKPRSNTAFAPVIQKWDGSGQIQHLLRINNGTLEFFIETTFTSAIGGTPPLGAWSHIAGVFGSGQLTNYLNGTSTASTGYGGSNTHNAADESLGGIDGAVAHAAIWNVELTPSQISYLAKGILPTSIRPTNLMGYWPLDEHEAGAYDYSGHNNFAYPQTVGRWVDGPEIADPYPIGLPQIAIPTYSIFQLYQPMVGI